MVIKENDELVETIGWEEVDDQEGVPLLDVTDMVLRCCCCKRKSKG